jgi:hypothetical protein
MDKEKIKKALDNFENDKFVDAKEIIAQEIKDKRNEFLKNKLGLNKDFEPKQKEENGDED